MTEPDRRSPSIRFTATPFNDLIGPELFVCDLCTAVVTNPQQHFRVHEATLWASATSDIFVPFMVNLPRIEEEPDVTDLTDSVAHRDSQRLLDATADAQRRADEVEQQQTDARPKGGTE